MATVHDFNEQLAYSQSPNHETWLIQAYAELFPTMIGQVPVRGDNPAAKNLGIDRYIHLANGRVLTLDEKIRSSDFGDFLIEFVRNDTTNAPGWIEKPELAVDYIAYVVVPAKQVYLLPLVQLQSAWAAHKAQWLKDYKTIKANNGTYNSLSVAVPRRVVYTAIVDSMHS